MGDVEPDPAAQRGELIGLVLPFQEGMLGSHYFEQVVLGVTEKLRAGGAHLVLHDSDEDLRGSSSAGRPGGMAGWLALASSTPHDLVGRLTATGRPFVLIGMESDDPAVSFVGVNDAQGIGEAVEHLVELGHREIGFVQGPEGVADARRREAGFRAAMRRHHCVPREEWIVGGGFKTEEAFLAVRPILREVPRPSAIVAANDLMALGAIEAARYLGLRIPEDLSVVGFDDLPVAAQQLPPLTTVHQPMRQLGGIAGEYLLERLRHGPTFAPLRRVLDVELALGGTTAPVETERKL